jgi:hypothetical protein
VKRGEQEEKIWIIKIKNKRKWIKGKEQQKKKPFLPFTKYTTLILVSLLFSFVYLFHDFKVVSILNVYGFMSLKVLQCFCVLYCF